MIKALSQASDYELVSRLQRSPADGKYFTALFCRYSPVVYSLIRHSARSPVQADYLFALTWRHILHELGGLDLAPRQSAEASESRNLAKEFSLQGWLINLTAAHINQAVMPEIESIHYALQAAPPPLWCYTERALESLSPEHRLMVLMAQTFEWSDTRIAAYLQAEGTQISPPEVRLELKAAYAALERAIPADISEIYLDHPPPMAPAIADELAGLLTIEFDEVDLQV